MNVKAFLAALFLSAVIIVAALPAAAEIETHAGLVKSSQKVGSYNYIQIIEEGKDVWIAASAFDLAAGDKLEYRGGTMMREFYSKTLNRTFPEILFVTNIRKVVEEQKPADLPLVAPRDANHASVAAPQEAMPQDATHKGLSVKNPVIAAPLPGEIIVSAGEFTVATVFADRDKLAGKRVSIKAKALKVSDNILGKTWATMSDGSGTAPDDKLLATTLQSVKIGESYTVSGIVRTHIDLGMGYSYKVMLEEALFTPVSPK